MRTSFLAVVCVALATMVSCSAYHVAETAPTEKLARMPESTASMGEDMVAEAEAFAVTNLNYRTAYTKTVTRPYRSASHAMGNVYVVPWVNDVGAESYANGEVPVPVGTVVVKEHFPVTESGMAAEEVAAYLVMRKMDAGYDAEHGDWYYAMVDLASHEAKAQGKVGMCIGCHINAADRDFLFGVPDSVRAN
jgi:hypothetical protein